ncbi:MAG: xanthine dehydrogenase molybdopterin binding subunit, partial [Pseudomonadota bacterium]
MNVRPVTPHVVERTIVGKGVAHDSAAKHVSGEAIYIDDMPDLPATLHTALITSPVAQGLLRDIQAEEARIMPGVAGIYLAQDIPGHNDIAPILTGEPLFAV